MHVHTSVHHVYKYELLHIHTYLPTYIHIHIWICIYIHIIYIYVYTSMYTRTLQYQEDRTCDDICINSNKLECQKACLLVDIIGL